MRWNLHGRDQECQRQRARHGGRDTLLEWDIAEQYRNTTQENNDGSRCQDVIYDCQDIHRAIHHEYRGAFMSLYDAWKHEIQDGHECNERAHYTRDARAYLT